MKGRFLVVYINEKEMLVVVWVQLASPFDVDLGLVSGEESATCEEFETVYQSYPNLDVRDPNKVKQSPSTHVNEAEKTVLLNVNEAEK